MTNATSLTAYLDTLRTQIADALGYSADMLEGVQLTHALQDVESAGSPVYWEAIVNTLCSLEADIDWIVL